MENNPPCAVRSADLLRALSRTLDTPLRGMDQDLWFGEAWRTRLAVGVAARTWLQAHGARRSDTSAAGDTSVLLQPHATTPGQFPAAGGAAPEQWVSPAESSVHGHGAPTPGVGVGAAEARRLFGAGSTTVGGRPGARAGHFAPK
jgi:hypothetical protein